MVQQWVIETIKVKLKEGQRMIIPEETLFVDASRDIFHTQLYTHTLNKSIKEWLLLGQTQVSYLQEEVVEDQEKQLEIQTRIIEGLMSEKVMVKFLVKKEIY